MTGESAIVRAVVAAMVLASFGIYSLLNKPSKAIVLGGRYDDKIPFVPVFIVPYILYFPYLFAVISYGIMTSPRWMEIALSALAVQLAAAAVYVIHQTHAPRPHVPGKDVFSRLTRYIYKHDEPYCAFPSLHVAYSVLCGYWAMVLFPSAAPFFLIFSLSIIASTVFVKQHVIADVISGAIMATLCLLLGSIL